MTVYSVVIFFLFVRKIRDVDYPREVRNLHIIDIIKEFIKFFQIFLFSNSLIINSCDESRKYVNFL